MLAAVSSPKMEMAELRFDRLQMRPCRIFLWPQPFLRQCVFSKQRGIINRRFQKGQQRPTRRQTQLRLQRANPALRINFNRDRFHRDQPSDGGVEIVG